MHFWHENVIHGWGVGLFKNGGIDEQTIKSLEKKIFMNSIIF